MKFDACTALILLACCVSKGQAIGGSSKQMGDTSVKFLSTAASSSMKTNLNMVNATIAILAKSMSGLMTPGQTEELQSAANILAPLVQQSVSLSEQVTGALSNLVLDPTTPIEVLFEQFEIAVQGISEYVTDQQTNIANSIKESMGCARAKRFLSSSAAYDKLLETDNIVTRIRRIVLNMDELHHGRQLPATNPVQLKNLVKALAKNIKDLNDVLAAFVTVVKSTVNGIEMSNSFLKGLISKEDMTRSDLNSTAIKTNSTVNTQARNVQNKYEAAQLAMKTDLTNALRGVNIFSRSKQLKNLVEDNQKAYSVFYKFLKKRSQSDLSDIANCYSELGNRAAKTINQTVEIYIGAVHRTGLRLADAVLEGGPHADSCYTTFSTKFYAPFIPLSTFVSSCVIKETTRWTALASAVDDMLKLAQSNSKELSSNLGRCYSMYTNFALSSEDYAQAETCLKTNLEDLEDLPKVMEPQLQNVNQLVKREAKASIFRVENCLITNLHEANAKLKFMRSAIEICAGPFDDCPRNNHDDDKKEWHNRQRDYVDNACKTVLEEEHIWK